MQRSGLLKVKGDEREVDKPKSDQCARADIPPIAARELVRLLAGRALERSRIRISSSYHAEQPERQQGWSQQNAKPEPVIATPRDHDGDHERSDRGSEGVERFVDAKRASAADFALGVRQHALYDRAPEGAACSFAGDQAGGGGPISCECETRHGEQIDCVAHEGERPISSGLVGHIACDRAQCVAEEFGDPGDDADDRSRRAQLREERSGDAASALVGEIGEKVHDADQDDESEDCRLAWLGQFRSPAGRFLFATRPKV